MFNTLFIREIHIKTMMRYHYTPLIADKIGIVIAQNAGEDVEKSLMYYL